MATAALTGTLRDATTGLPIADAEVRAAAVEPAGSPSVATRTDAGGTFALTLFWSGPGEARVEIDARGPAHAAARWPRYDFAPDGVRVADGGALVADLALAPGFSLALDVVDDAGQPVAGAVVDVIENNTVANCCTWPLAHRWLPEDQSRPRTDAGGHLTIPGLRTTLAFGERYFVSVRHPDRAEGLLDRPENLVREPGGLAHARVVLPVGHVVEGTLRGAGRLGESQVIAVLDDASIPGCHAVTRTAVVDADGRFRVTGLRDGEHDLSVTTPGASPVRVAVTMPLSGPVDIELWAGRRVSGSVLGVGGEVVAGATVGVSWPPYYRETTTDALGAFTLEGLPVDSRLDLTVESGGSFTERSTSLGYAVLDPSADDASLVIDARRRVRWAGRIHDDRTLAPLLDATMVLAQVRGTTIVLRTVGETPDGRFAALLPPGTYVIGLEALGELDAVASALVRDVVIEEGTPQEDVRVDAAAAFRAPVLVVDAATGAPLVGAAVTGHPLHLWGRVHMGNTAADGLFHLEPAAEAPVVVVAEAEGYAPRTTARIELRRDMEPIVMKLDHQR